MNILISLDDGYLKYTLVMLTSIFENNTDSPITIYLFYTNTLSENSVSRIRDLILSYGQTLYSQVIDLSCFSDIPDSPWPKEVLIRLIAFSLVPTTVERLLYLDGDIIVNRNLSELYNMDFEGNYAIACEDSAISHKDLDLYAVLKMENEDCYYNSGVLLMNIKKLRHNYSKRQMIEYIQNNISKLIYPDQDILNKMFYKQIKAVPAKIYNCIVGQYHWTQEKEILQNTVIIHFAGETTRPWNLNYRYHYSSAVSGEVWWKYARICGYQKEYRKWKIQNTIRVKPWQICYRIVRRRKNKGLDEISIREISMPIRKNMEHHGNYIEIE